MSDTPTTGSFSRSEPLREFWKPNLGPLQGQQTLKQLSGLSKSFRVVLFCFALFYFCFVFETRSQF